MTNGVEVSPGLGATIATTDRGGYHYQRVEIWPQGNELMFGQQVAAASLPVILSSEQPALIITGTVDIGAMPAVSVTGSVTITGSVVVSASALPTNAAQETGGNLDKIYLGVFALKELSDQSLELLQSILEQLQAGNDVESPDADQSLISRITAATSSVTLMRQNNGRLGGTLFNESSAVAYVKLGKNASTTDYTVQIAASGYYELPPLPRGGVYRGQIDAVWASATGAMQVTEILD